MVAVLWPWWVCAPKTAAADDRVPMGGGAGIVINGDTMCTLTTIGGDSAGELIGFTSAHCGAQARRSPPRRDEQGLRSA